jgi:hypothetical protein
MRMADGEEGGREPLARGTSPLSSPLPSPLARGGRKFVVDNKLVFENDVGSEDGTFSYFSPTQAALRQTYHGHLLIL